MRRILVREYCVAPGSGPSETDVGSTHATRNAVQLGHPSVIAFSPGDDLARSRLSDLEVAIEQDESLGNIHLSARKTGSGGTEEWTAVHAPSPLVVDYVVAIVDKQRNTAKLVDVSGEFCLTRNLKHIASGQPENNGQVRDERSYAEKRSELLETFGSKRARESKAKSSLNAITDARISAETANHLESAIGAHQEKYSGRDGAESTTSTLAPPHNPKAARPEGAYPLGGLMTSVEYGYLQGEAESFLEKAVQSKDISAIQNPGFGDTAWALLLEAAGIRIRESSSKGASSSERRLDEACGRAISAMYLHFLIVLAQSGTTLGVRDRSALVESMGVPQEVLHCILDRFTERQVGKSASERLRSEAMRSRLVYYAVVYWLTASGFAASGSLEQIAGELQITPAKFMIHIAHVGGKVKRMKAEAKGSTAYRAYLSAPLVFPPLRRRAPGPKRK
jgi:A49-like RNA polymerase I associated factor